MKKLLLLTVFFSSFIFGQNQDDLNKYTNLINIPIADALQQMVIKPKDKTEILGVTRVIYSKSDHIIGFTESTKDNGLVGDVFVYTQNSNDPVKKWYTVYQNILKDTDYKEVQANYEDTNKNFKTNDLKINEIVQLLRSLNSTAKISWGVVYKKGDIFYSIYVLGDKFVYKVSDHK